jgi:hypothetical protein
VKGTTAMWDGVKVKAQGKINFKNNYFNSVLVSIIYSIFFIASGSSAKGKADEVGKDIIYDPDFIKIMIIVLSILGVILAASFLVKIFLINPLEIGCNRFFIVNQYEKANIGELSYSYKNNYINAVSGIFLRDLFIILGLFLFVIPGVIITYSYRMVPYILAENPTVKGVDALRISREMMKGNKWSAFVYDLSFIGWYLLGCITCGIALAFYVYPYKLNADAQLYLAIKKQSGYTV